MAWTRFIGNPMMNVLLTGKGDTNGLHIAPFNQSNCPYQCIYTESRTQDCVILNIGKLILIERREGIRYDLSYMELLQ
ncbi:hypothetical protein DdX_19703 [Ditylenchus destructor]|uniref:Uncharacterized protein n=1 Tax=Ditylenchus destructor TaxID=166010 RepID=A0AAD4MJY6_9BILA|nr:hypothetical protein DdX_19703 [Ditylenchus destructor]